MASAIGRYKVTEMNRKIPSASSLVIFAMLFAKPLLAETLDAAYFAKLLFEAKIAGKLLPDIYRINPDIDEQSLYDIQKHYIQARLAAGEAIGGYKGGFVPKASIGGVLFGGDKILRGRPAIKLDEFSLLVVEAEIGFRFCEPITEAVADVATLKKHVCEILPVMEVADGAIADFGKVKKNFEHLRNTLISINVAASYTFLGDAGRRTIDLSSIPVSMRHNDEQIGRRDLSKDFDFWQNLKWIVNDYVIARGYSVEPGQFIIAGNLTGIHVASRGEYVADFGELGKLTLLVE